MNQSVLVKVLQVFVNENREYGNAVGIIIDEKRKSNLHLRQQISNKLGFSETVYINDIDTGEVNIFNPVQDVDFSGHALIGTAYYIHTILQKSISSLQCKIGKIDIWEENNLSWVRASLDGTPPWIIKQLNNASEVDQISQSDIPSNHTMVWSWKDESKGIIRARTFAPDWGIPEDEANGSGSMQLASILHRSLEIHHGKGSVIYAKSAGNGVSDVGGRVKENTDIIIEI